MISKKILLKPTEEILVLYKNRVSSKLVSDSKILLEKIKKKETRLNQLQSKKNQLSKLIADETTPAEKTKAIEKSSQLSPEIKSIKEDLKKLKQKLEFNLLMLPNIPNKRVSFGENELQNSIYKDCFKKPVFNFSPKTYWQLNETLEIVDEKSGAKISQNRFSVLRNHGAILERALMNFMLDTHTQESGYHEIGLPLAVNENTFTASGQFPKFKDQAFETTSDLYLIPTAEVPLISLYSDYTFKSDELPVKLVAHTPCFRKEAGTYGKKDKGYIRQHQFNKVELVQLVKPEASAGSLKEILSQAESIVKKLNLPYRVVKLCSGELGFSAAECYDIEVWFPGSNRFIEVSSCSNCTDFQARRANIKYKDDNSQKNKYIHTLNGSGLAVGRILMAIFENFQQCDGTVIIPEVIFPYTKGLTKLTLKK